MKLIADEDIELSIITRLRADGHEVIAITEEVSGSEDPVVLARAVTQQVLLLTADRDFGDYIYRDQLPAPTAGVVLHRLPNRMPSQQKASIIADAFSRYAGQFAGHFTVIEEQKVRFRVLPTTNLP